MQSSCLHACSSAAAQAAWGWAFLGGMTGGVQFNVGVQHLRPPSAYMAANWPLKVASVSRDGLDIAVAGQRGLALYSRRCAARFVAYHPAGQQAVVVANAGGPNHAESDSCFQLSL